LLRKPLDIRLYPYYTSVEFWLEDLEEWLRAMPVTSCPECDEDIRLGKARLGQIVTCQHCGVRLEVVEAEPLEVDWAEDEEDDLDDGDDLDIEDEEEQDDPLLNDADELLADDDLDVLVEEDEDMDDGEE
jgi:lysine biosynthesis protein LysW